MKAIILCGGLGTRLGELTRDTPKPLLDVAGRPFVTHVMDHLIDGGVDEIALAVSFRWERFRDSLGYFWRGVPLRYSIEPSPLGTGGAVRQALERMGWEDALVANGDTLVEIEPSRLVYHAQRTAADVVLTLCSVTDTTRYGGVRLAPDTRVQGFQEKGIGGAGLINGGLYWLHRSALGSAVDSTFSLEADLLATRWAQLRMFGTVTDGYFIDIGVPQDLERARREL